MRNLIIKRTKSFVGCLSKMKIYIEDPTSNEIIINNTPCRKIGDLKNGEEKTFQITEQESKVFVIGDKSTKEYCCEYYQLPESSEDIVLSGKNKFNPAAGNAFRFDNNESQGIDEYRKQGVHKGVLILIIAVVIGAIAGFLTTSELFLNKTPDVKNFSSNGMTIALTDEFTEVDVVNFTAAYESENVFVFALKEAFTLFDGFGDNSIEQYTDLVIESNSLDSVQTKTDDGLTLFEYTYTLPDTNDVYKYFAYTYKANDAFWLIQFAVLNESADEYAQQITEWANSVEFDS